MIKTPTSILATIPASYRINRKQVGSAEQQIRNLEQKSENFTVKQLSYGVLWADHTGRISGTVSLAIRRANAWQSAKLLAAMASDGLSLPSEVPAWLNSKAISVLD